MSRAKPMFLVPIALIVEGIGLVQFIVWVAPSCVYTDIVLDGIANKLQCSMFYIKRVFNRVPTCVIISILG